MDKYRGVRLLLGIVGVLLAFETIRATPTSSGAPLPLQPAPPNSVVFLPFVAKLFTSQTPIYIGTTLTEGYNMGVDTSEHRSDWVRDMHGYMMMSYPPGQDWGAVFITVGNPAPPGQRANRDLSAFHTLSLDIMGENGNETITVGLKDDLDPDDGSETLLPVKVSSHWQTCLFPLSKFTTADTSRLYVPVEFIFGTSVGQEIVYFRNIQYLWGAVSNTVCQ